MLSKSQFIRGLQCHKSLWLYKNRPDLREEPDDRQMALFESGKDVGILAHGLFPGGEEIKFDYKKIKDNAIRTESLITKGIKTIYEATFIYNGLLVMVDILHKGKEGWGIYEVKSSTGINEVYCKDAAFQYYVVKGCGIVVDKTSIVHINNLYVRKGNLDIKKIFCIRDISDIVLSGQSRIPGQISEMTEMSGKKMPDMDIGHHCDLPYECDFKPFCWKHIPEVSVFNLTGMKSKKKFELYEKNIIKYEDILSIPSLTGMQNKQISAEIEGSEYLDKPGVSEFLNLLADPAGYMDFETFQDAVPSFNNQKPYQQIPFQYSLHVNKNGKTDHFEFLAEKDGDPRKMFIEQLINETTDCKTLVVYNKGFEIRILKELRTNFPEYSEKIQDMINKIVDLMAVFQKGYCYNKKMKGKYSIKYVLPALLPELSYNNLDISNGGMAMDAFKRMRQETDAEEIEKTRKSLLDYCKLDTLAMVKIVDRLKELVNKNIACIFTKF